MRYDFEDWRNEVLLETHPSKHEAGVLPSPSTNIRGYQCYTPEEAGKIIKWASEQLKRRPKRK